MAENTPDDTAAPSADSAAARSGDESARRPATRATKRPGKAPAKRPAKATAKRPARHHAEEPDSRRDGQGAQEPAQRPARRGWELAVDAAAQLQQLTGCEVEGITGLRRTDDGWQVQVDVLELRRVPNTTDVIASYDVDVDADGELSGYRRARRFVRGEVGDDR
jgi:hypothetical protein